MTTFTSDDRENAEKDEFAGGIPIPFVGWLHIDKENTEQMLRDQLAVQQKEINKWISAYQDVYAKWLRLGGKDEKL